MDHSPCSQPSNGIYPGYIQWTVHPVLSHLMVYTQVTYSGPFALFSAIKGHKSRLLHWTILLCYSQTCNEISMQHVSRTLSTINLVSLLLKTVTLWKRNIWLDSRPNQKIHIVWVAILAISGLEYQLSVEHKILYDMKYYLKSSQRSSPPP